MDGRCLNVVGKKKKNYPTIHKIVCCTRIVITFCSCPIYRYGGVGTYYILTNFVLRVQRIE